MLSFMIIMKFQSSVRILCQISLEIFTGNQFKETMHDETDVDKNAGKRHTYVSAMLYR